MNKNKHYASVEDRTDHQGKVFDTIEDMCKYWGVLYATYAQRLKNGWTKEKALTTPATKISIEDRTDHLGQVFDTIKLMCEYWGIDSKTYNRRIKKGWPKEKALTTPATKVSIEDRTDHLGQVFDSIDAMCEYWGINRGCYAGRIRNGWTKEKALTTPSVLSTVEYRTDHLGQVFDSINDMCEYWGISRGCYDSRIKNGWTKEKALTTPVTKVSIEDRTDHLGQVFDSINAMCEYWGIDGKTYNRRIKKGWTKEKALTTPVTKVSIEDRTDPLNQVFDSINAMCRYWSVTRVLYDNRINNGCSKIQALNISITPRQFSINIKQKKYNLYVDKRIYKDKDIFECRIFNGTESTFKIMNQEMIDQYCLECYKREHNIAA